MYVDFSRETGEINQILDVYLPKKIKPLSGFVSATFNQVLTYSIDLCCDQILNTPFTCQTLFFFFFLFPCFFLLMPLMPLSVLTWKKCSRANMRHVGTVVHSVNLMLMTSTQQISAMLEMLHRI